MTKKKENPQKAGRKTSFRHDHCEEAYTQALLGKTEEQIAKHLNISYRTLCNWKVKHPEFMQALKNGKDPADARVAMGLYERATGVRCTEERTVEESYTDPETGKEIKKKVTTKVVREIPPDTIACIFWLKNRQPEMWRDKPAQEKNEDVAKALIEVVKGLPGA